MRLELGKVRVDDVQFGEKTYIENHVLYVNAQEIVDLVMQDDRLASCKVELARPGESVRSAPVKDVIEPRIKMEGPGNIWPGVMGKVDCVGEGVTYAMDGAAVVTVGKIVGFQEGIIDMSGEGAQYTPFSKTNNICVVFSPVEGLTTHSYENAGRMAGMKTAAYLAKALKTCTPDETNVYETKPLLEQAAQYPELPKVGYVQMLQSQGLLHDTYYYGVDAKLIVPTFLFPTETMDGAITSGNCVAPGDKVTTYHQTRNPVIEDLYAQHGKTINFMGVVVTNENVYLADKERSSNMTAKLCKQLGFDAVILTEEGFGNPDTDLMMNCKKITNMGIKVVIITDEFPGKDGKSYSLADVDKTACAVVSCGNANGVVHFPAMDKIIGSMDYIEEQVGGWNGCKNPDGSFDAEVCIVVGSTCEIGYSNLSCHGY